MSTRHVHVALADIALASRPDRHIRPAAISAARVDRAFVEHRHRNRKAIRLLDVPQELARCRVVPADALARVDDELRAPLAGLHDQRRAVGVERAAAIDAPLRLARRRIEIQQVRVGVVIADEE